MKKYIVEVTEDYDKKYSFKARLDIIELLKKGGYEELRIKTNREQSIKTLVVDLFKNYKSLKEVLSKVEENSIIVFQYPWDSMTYKYSKYIKKICKKKNCKSVIAIIDLNSIRTTSKFGYIYFSKVVNEFKYLNNFDYIISHNQKMTDLLVDKKVDKEKIYNLNILDYLNDNKIENNIDDFKKVIIAGNLNRTKAGFAYELDNLGDLNYSIDIYGINYDYNLTNKNIKYHGSLPDEKLMKKLNYGFGLVWDGDSIDTCETSQYGRYMLINNPYKFSLYMACGIPVIVWKKSAIAEYVKKNNLGILIDSLNDLNDVFSKMTKKDYLNYIDGVKKVQKRVSTGKNTLDIINKIEKINNK